MDCRFTKVRKRPKWFPCCSSVLVHLCLISETCKAVFVNLFFILRFGLLTSDVKTIVTIPSFFLKSAAIAAITDGRLSGTFSELQEHL